jgi:hypothetical protein
MARISKVNPIVYFLLALALVRGVIYASVVPPWQAPDEPAHFERVRAALVAEEWQGSSGDPEWYNELRDSLYRFGFGDFLIYKSGFTPDQPLRDYIGLYHEIYGGVYGNRSTYAAMGLPLFVAPVQDVTLQLYLVRLNTVLMGAAIVLLAYFTAQVIFPGQPFLYLGVPILILFIPQHTHMLSTVNNGNLAELLAAIFFCLVAWGLMRGFSWLSIIALLAAALAAMWTKATTYFLIVPIGLLGLLYLWQYRHQWRWLALAAIPLLGISYYFAPTRLKILLGWGFEDLAEGKYEWPPYLITSIFRSFWAVPGWTALQLEALWYNLILISCLLAGVGLVILLVRQRQTLVSDQFRPQLQVLCLFAISIMTALGIQVGWQIITASSSYSQGRTLYPVIIPIATLLMLGWQQVIPPAWQKAGFLAMIVAFFLFDALVIFGYIIPFFYTRY